MDVCARLSVEALRMADRSPLPRNPIRFPKTVSKAAKKKSLQELDVSFVNERLAQKTVSSGERHDPDGRLAMCRFMFRGKLEQASPTGQLLSFLSPDPKRTGFLDTVAKVTDPNEPDRDSEL
jgi:hypothetical protein